MEHSWQAPSILTFFINEVIRVHQLLEGDRGHQFKLHDFVCLNNPALTCRFKNNGELLCVEFLFNKQRNSGSQ